MSTRFDNPEESDGVPAGKIRVYFATACWDKERFSSVPEAVASPTFKTEPALREWCRNTRAKYGDRERFELHPVERTLTLDTRGKPIPGLHDDRVLSTHEHRAGADYVAVQVEFGRELLHGAVTHVDSLLEKPRQPEPYREPDRNYEHTTKLPTYDEIYGTVPLEAEGGE